MKRPTIRQEGPNTWPISLVSYVYIRKDLSFIENPVERTLLKAFATSLFDPDYIGLCERFGHIPVPDKVKGISMAGIEALDWDATDEQEWMFEKETTPGWGQGDLVISKKRQNFALYEADRLADDIAPLMADVRKLKLELAQAKASGLSSGAAGVSLVWGLGALVGTSVLALL